ncbi:MAG: GTP-binding protein [Pseudonocardiaceae bacterium]
MNVARTPVIIVAGLAVAAVHDVADALVGGHTAVVHHDLAELPRGMLVRRIRCGTVDDMTARRLAHGCVSCALREELLGSLAVAADIHRIVLHLDPTMEPETVCCALAHMVVDGTRVADVVTVQAVLTVVDAQRWLADTIGNQRLAQRRLLPRWGTIERWPSSRSGRSSSPTRSSWPAPPWMSAPRDEPTRCWTGWRR